MNNQQTLQPVISVNDLKVHFPIRKGIFGSIKGHVKAVDGISFTVKKGEMVALVGESGCGKTTTAQAILGLTHQTSGTIDLGIGPWAEHPVKWDRLNKKENWLMRRHLQVVFQDPYSSLDPRMTIGSILDEPLAIHQFAKNERTERIRQMLAKVGLSPEYLRRFPHEFSGGQRQRIGIARALITGPEVVIADEPVSALDVSIQAQIINLLQDLQKDYNLTMLFISHDLAVVRHIANRLAVMYMGKIVESGTDEQIFNTPLHPYTHLLLESVPLPGKGRSTRGQHLRDDQNVQPPETGCPFYPRCPKRTEECLINSPELKDQSDEHFVSCFNLH
jgi:oligopeptide/dipeptide ABC transporter ATP-binding protein